MYCIILCVEECVNRPSLLYDSVFEKLIINYYTHVYNLLVVCNSEGCSIPSLLHTTTLTVTYFIITHYTPTIPLPITHRVTH